MKPRTLPIESESAVGSKQTIFGVGKAHDDNAYEELKKKTQISDKDDTNACIVDSVLFNPSEVLMQDKSIMKADGKQCGSSVQHATGKLKPRDSKPNVRNKYVKPVVNSVVNGEDNSHDKLLDGKSSVKFSKANKSLLKGNAFILKPEMRTAQLIPTLTDQEKFNRAQERVKYKMDTHGESIPSLNKSGGGFAALNMYDESENSDC